VEHAVRGGGRGLKLIQVFFDLFETTLDPLGETWTAPGTKDLAATISV